MPDVPPLRDHANPVPLHEPPGYLEALRAAQTVQGCAPDLPCGRHRERRLLCTGGRSGSLSEVRRDIRDL